MLGAQSNFKKLFRDRFEPDGDGYLFRPRATSPGIHVTADERDGFVADFERALRMTWWLGLGASVPFVLLLVGVSVVFPDAQLDWLPYIVIIGAVVALSGYNIWILNAPARALRHRLPTQAGRSPADARRISLQRMPWTNFAAAFAGVAFLAYRFYPAEGPFAGRGWLWLAGVTAFGALLVVQMIRKWRAGPGTGGE